MAKGALMGGLAALAVVVVAYTVVASKLDRWWITGAMVFVATGAVLGPGGLDVLPFSLANETVLTITELTLALLLFSDASTVRLREVEGDAGLPRRLLFVGLPLTVIAGALVARLMFPEVGWAAAALIATILAPTDAALGLAVVAAVVVGYLGGKLLALADERGWTSEVSEQIAILALALLAYEGAVTVGGNGFIAAFTGGILFGAATRQRLAEPVQFTETLGLSGSFVVWSIFGALFVGELLTRGLSARPIIYALLSLTVIRMVPVAVALTGTQLRPATVAFMGWFGPRGLASVVFTLLALEEIEHSGSGSMLVETVTWTILLSVVLHGISASPLATRYGASIARAGKVSETAPAGEPQIRLHDLAGRHGPQGQQARVPT